MSRWPDFIGLGVIKSGTTWLHRRLAEHPEIELPRTKEIQYFDKNHGLGEEWYKSFFLSDRYISGEISPQYLPEPSVFDRIVVVPDSVKFVVSFRNPVDRAYSHYQMDYREHSTYGTHEKVQHFDNIVNDVASKYVQFGLYADQLRPYIEHFGLERFHFVLFEDILTNPSTVLHQLYSFLGVDEGFIPSNLDQKENVSKKYRNVVLFRTLRGIIQFSNQIGLASLIRWLKLVGVRDKVLNMMETKHAYIPMTPLARKILTDYYHASNLELSDLIGLDVSSWSNQ